MSVRHLEHLFQPRSVAVIGVSRRADGVGALVWRNLREGGFAGPLWAVNRQPFELDGGPVFTSVDDLGQWFGRMLRRLRGLHPVRAPGVSPTPEAPPATH